MCVKKNTRIVPICDPLEIIQCIMRLTPLEINTYKLLLSKGSLAVKELASLLKCSRSAVQKALQRLYTLGLVNRQKVLRRSGGYMFIYKAVPLEEVDDECIKLVLKLASLMARKYRSLEVREEHLNEHNL